MGSPVEFCYFLKRCFYGYEQVAILISSKNQGGSASKVCGLPAFLQKTQKLGCVKTGLSIPALKWCKHLRTGSAVFVEEYKTSTGSIQPNSFRKYLGKRSKERIL